MTLPAWVLRGAAVRCIKKFTTPLILRSDWPPSSLSVLPGEMGRILSVNEVEVRIWVGPPENWDGGGDPEAPFTWCNILTENFASLWKITCFECEKSPNWEDTNFNTVRRFCDDHVVQYARVRLLGKDERD